MTLKAPFLIDQEFQRLIPPLAEVELRELEASILNEGVRDPLVIWRRDKGNPVLVDGHHRWKLIQKHGLKSYRTVSQCFRDREEVIEYIIRNQCARRNISIYTRTTLWLKLEESLKARAKQNQRLSKGRGEKGGMTSIQPFHVDEELARLAGVSRQTLQRVRFLEQHAEDSTKRILASGELSINKGYKFVRKAAATRESVQFISGNGRSSESLPESIRLHVGDALEFLRGSPDESYEAIVTDPPQGVGLRYDGKRELYDKAEGYGEWISSVAREMDRVLKPGGFLAVFQCGKHFRYLWDWFGKDILIYAHCRNFTQLRGSEPIAFAYDPVVMRYKPGTDPLRPAAPSRNLNFYVSQSASQLKDIDALEALHPCPRPLDAVEEIVRNFTAEGGTVLDPFVGSGTTAVACLRNGRRFVGVDSSKRYVWIAKARITKECEKQVHPPTE